MGVMEAAQQAWFFFYEKLRIKTDLVIIVLLQIRLLIRRGDWQASQPGYNTRLFLSRNIMNIINIRSGKIVVFSKFG